MPLLTALFKKKKLQFMYIFAAIAVACLYSADMFLNKSNCHIVSRLIFPFVKIERFIENMSLKICYQINTEDMKNVSQQMREMVWQRLS